MNAFGENRIVEQTADFLKVTINPIKDKKSALDLVDRVENWIKEELQELREALQEENKEEQLNAIVDANVFLHNLTALLGFEESEFTYEAFCVAESNRSKFSYSREEADRTVEAYANGTHPNKLGEKVEAYVNEVLLPGKLTTYVIRRKGDDKILKSINFKDADFFRI